METARARFSPIEIFLSDLSPVIGAHVGPGVLAIAYMAGVEEIIAASGLLAIRQENQAQIATTGEPTYA